MDSVTSELTPVEKLALDGAPVMVWVAGLDSKGTWFNRGWLEFTGRTMAQELGDGWAEGVHPEDLAICMDVYTKAFAAREPFEMDFRLRHVSGSYRWIVDRGTPRWASDGSFLGFIGTTVDIDERKEMAQAVDCARREAERMAQSAGETAEELRTLADSIPTLVFKTGPHGGMRYANEAWISYTGHKPGPGSAGREWGPLVHPDDAGATRDMWLESIATGEAYETTYRLRRHDGEYRWHYVRAAPVANAAGQVEAWYGTCTDIDDKVRSDEAWMASERRLRLAQRVAGMGTWEWDIVTNLFTWSPEMESLCGLPEGSFDGNFDTYARLVHPDDRPRLLESMEGMLHTGAHASEYRILLPDGGVRWLSTRGELFRDAAGAPARAVGVALDITGRKQYELALTRIGRRMRMLAEAGAALSSTSPAPEVLREVAQPVIDCGFAEVCVFDLLEGGEFHRVVAEGATSLDAATVDALRDHLPRLDQPGDVVSQVMRGKDAVVALGSVADAEGFVHDDKHRALLMRLGLASTLVVRLQHEDERHGVTILSRTAGTEPFDSDDRDAALDLGRRVAIGLSARHLTSQLQRQNTVKDEVLGLISHELRTPLTTLKGNASTLARHSDRIRESDRQVALEDIGRDADRLERIIENMLVLARVEGIGETELEPTLIHQIVRMAMAEFAERFPGKELKVQMSDEPLLVLGHETYLRQIVMNLLSNAVKYGGDQPVELQTKRDGDWGIITVGDRGPGLSDKMLTRVFEPFFRSPRDSGRAPGVGLGLTVCRRLLDELGGRIEARQREGGGTEFVATLPLMSDEDE